MGDMRQYYPPIYQTVEINGGLYLKLGETAAQEHMRIDHLAEKLIAEGLANMRIFKAEWPPNQETR